MGSYLAWGFIGLVHIVKSVMFICASALLCLEDNVLLVLSTVYVSESLLALSEKNRF